MTGAGEAIIGADLVFNDNREDVCHTGKGPQQLHVASKLDALQDAFFERGDLLHDGIEEIKYLFKTATGFSRKFLEVSMEPDSAFTDEDIAVIRIVESVLGKCGVNTVPESSTRLRECHRSCSLTAYGFGEVLVRRGSHQEVSKRLGGFRGGPVWRDLWHRVCRSY